MDRIIAQTFADSLINNTEEFNREEEDDDYIDELDFYGEEDDEVFGMDVLDDEDDITELFDF